MKYWIKIILLFVLVMQFSCSVGLTGKYSMAQQDIDPHEILARILEGHQRFSVADQLERFGEIIAYAEYNSKKAVYFATIQHREGLSTLTVFQDIDGRLTRTQFGPQYLCAQCNGRLFFCEKEDGRLELHLVEEGQEKVWSSRTLRACLDNGIWDSVIIDYIYQLNGQEIQTSISQDNSLFRFDILNKTTLKKETRYMTDIPIGLNVYGLCIDDVPYSYENAKEKYRNHMKDREKIAEVDRAFLDAKEVNCIELWGYSSNGKSIIDFLLIQNKDKTEMWVPFQPSVWSRNDDFLRYEDANFDGKLDLMVCKDIMSNGYEYTYFIWNEESHCFEKNDFFSMLPSNPSFDYDLHEIHCIVEYGVRRDEFIYAINNGIPHLVEQFVFEK